MRRAAGYTSTGSAPTTKLKQLAARGAYFPLVQHPPSALVYSSQSIWPVSSRYYSAKAEAKPASWPTRRKESLWTNAATTSKGNDDRLGQEEGQRLIESAFLQADSTPDKGSKKAKRSKKRSKKDKPPTEPLRDSPVSRERATVGPAEQSQDVGGAKQEAKPAQSKASASSGSVSEQLMAGRRIPVSPTAELSLRSRPTLSSRRPPPSRPPHVGMPIRPPRELRRAISLRWMRPMDTASEGTASSSVVANGQGAQPMPSKPTLMEPSTRRSTNSHSPPSTYVPIGYENATRGRPQSGSTKTEGEQSPGSSDTLLRDEGGKGSLRGKPPSVSPSAGIWIDPTASATTPQSAGSVDSVDDKSIDSTPFSWKPWIRDSFEKRVTAEYSLAPPQNGSLMPEGASEKLLPLNYAGLLPSKDSQQHGSARASSLKNSDRRGLIAEIWEKAPELPGFHRDARRKGDTNTAPESVHPALSDHKSTPVRPALWSTWDRRPSNVSEWKALAAHLQRNFGADIAWEAMVPLANEDRDLLARPEADVLRDAFLAASIGDDIRLNQFVRVATRLRDELGYEWPDLYGNVMYRLLDEAEPGRAVFWHSRLYTLFAPSQAVFAALLSHFVVDPSPEMQSTLLKLHNSSKGSRLYDTIIARLFDFGQSSAAREWRRRLLSFNDFPLSETSAPFLRFLLAYYPSLELTAEERDVLELKDKPPAHVKTKTEAELEEIKRSIHGDHIVAKWFASTWTTVEFAIDLIHRFGVTVVGPLALQALGLRDPGAKNLTEHLKQLEGLGVVLAPMTYCRVIAHFARQGEDELLEGVLTCDVHPDEFEDMETVRMLAMAAESRRDPSQHRLMRGIEMAMQTIGAQEDTDEPSAIKDVVPIQSCLTPTQGDSAELLDLTFEQLGYHPVRWLRSSRRKGEESTRLGQAVAALRQAFANDVPIPLDYWKRVIYNFGRVGRFKSLEQLCLELVEIYGRSNARLIPVHPQDVPASSSGRESRQSDSANTSADPDGLELWQRALVGRATGAQEVGFLPTDLPFSHRQHPVQKIFHQRLQRSMIRWGFDYALRVMHRIRGPSWRHRSMNKSAWRAAHLSQRGIGQGLRILAKLRDKGVLIDKQIVQSEIVRRVVAAEFPGRGQAPWMDHHELDLTHVVRLVNEIWGPGIFESSEDLRYMVRARRTKLREHYWKNRRLFGSRDGRPAQ